MTEIENEEETEKQKTRYELAAEKLGELTEEEKEFLSLVSNLMGKLLIDKQFKEIVKYEVRKKLGGILVTSDSNDIANDAISHVVESTRISIILKTTTSLSKEKLGDRTLTLTDIQTYLINGIRNYCNTRLQRWSTDQKPAPKNKKSNDQEAAESEGNESNVEKKPKGKIAVRAREYISSDCASDSDFWDQHISTSLNEEDLDLVKAAEILRSKGVSEDQIDLVLERIAGKSFSDMAKENGGSEDKYRKAFERAIKKIGIEKDFLINK